MTKNLWRRCTALLVALGLTLTMAIPAIAWEDEDPQYLYQWIGHAGHGEPYDIAVCATQNFDAPDGSWDNSLRRMARMQDAIDEVNTSSYVYGLGVHYHSTSTACSNLPDPWLGIGWDDNNVCGTALACFDTGEELIYPFQCLTNCLKNAYIWFSMPPFDDYTSWYMGGDNTYSTTAQQGEKYSMEEVAVHEMGHSLGLGHSGNAGAVMCSTKMVAACSNSGNHADTIKVTPAEGTETSEPFFHLDDNNGLNALWP